MFVAWFRWLQHPLVDVAEINRRQAMVQTMCNEKALMDTLQKGSGMLRGMPGEMYLSTYAENSSITSTFYSYHSTFGWSTVSALQDGRTRFDVQCCTASTVYSVFVFLTMCAPCAPTQHVRYFTQTWTR